MSDVLLKKPMNGQRIDLTPQADDRLVLEFKPNDALSTRDGDNLVMSFEDGKFDTTDCTATGNTVTEKDNVHNSFTEFKDDEGMTILVHQTLLTSG